MTVSACRVPDGGAGVDRDGKSTWFWVVQSLFWTIGLLIVLIPLAIRRYRTRT